MITVRKTFQAYIALLVLFLLTWACSYLKLGPINTALSLAIALAKAALIALIFMRLKESSSLVRVFSGVGVFWLGVLLFLTLTDYLSRNWTRIPSLWPQAPLPAEITQPRTR